MGEMILGLLLGLIWGFVAFSPSPHDNQEIRKDGAIQVYEGRMKCEKAMNTWVCDKPEASQKGDN